MKPVVYTTQKAQELDAILQALNVYGMTGEGLSTCDGDGYLVVESYSKSQWVAEGYLGRLQQAEQGSVQSALYAIGDADFTEIDQRISEFYGEVTADEKWDIRDEKLVVRNFAGDVVRTLEDVSCYYAESYINDTYGDFR